ncbi:hypothetical protein R0K17_18765, partial [Planococcus sp. SIMBA_143]
IFIMLKGNELIPFLLGEKWTEVTTILPWIMVWTATMFIYMPATKLVIIQQWQKYMLWYNMGLFITRIMLLFFGSYHYDFFEIIIALCILNSIANTTLAIITGIFLFIKERGS